MLTMREAILLKPQASRGAEVTPDPSIDAVLVSDVGFANEGLVMAERNNVKPSLATDQKIFVGTMKKISFTAELKGSGTAGTPPEVGQALRCCALSEVIGAGEVAYQPVSDPETHEVCTIYYHQDGVLKKMTDCVGTVTINASGETFGTLAFEFTGHDAGKVDAGFPTITYSNTVPKPFVNVPFEVGGYGAVISSLTLNVGNNIVIDKNIRTASGFGDVRVSKRDPNGTIDPLATKKSVNDFETAFKNGDLLPMTTGKVGDASGNQWQLDTTIAIRDIGQGDREGSRTDDLTYGCHETTTDDEFKLIFS